MIQANQLRAGNLVFGPLDEIMKIVLIDDTCDPCYLYAHCIDGSGHGQNGFEPIPITEEWLLKFGFIKQDNDIDTWYQIEIKDGYYLEYFISMSYTSLILIEVNNITGDNQFILPNTPKYVHELQNIYYALTQKELEIK